VEHVTIYICNVIDETDVTKKSAWTCVTFCYSNYILY